jgi:hypothetical protein
VRVSTVSGPLHLSARSLPPFELLIVFCLVVSGRLMASYRRVPWRAVTRATRTARRLHFLFLFVGGALGPVCLLGLPSLRPVPGTGGGAATEIVLAVHAWTFAVLAFIAPFAVLWLASAEHIKTHGALDTTALVRARWRDGARAVRDWFPLFALVYAYGLLEPVIGRGLFGDQDVLLERLDRLMFFGHDPRVLASGMVSRPLSVWLSASYVLYVPLVPVVLGVVYARADPWGFRELALAVTFVLATGYVLYTVVPAQGPLFVGRFDVPLDGYYGDWIKRDLLDPTRVPRDCFPSLHTAVSLTLLWGAFRHARAVFWCILPVVLSIPLACIYFRYHYVVDVLAGVLLFAVAARFAARASTVPSPRAPA